MAPRTRPQSRPADSIPETQTIAGGSGPEQQDSSGTTPGPRRTQTPSVSEEGQGPQGDDGNNPLEQSKEDEVRERLHAVEQRILQLQQEERLMVELRAKEQELVTLLGNRNA